MTCHVFGLGVQLKIIIEAFRNAGINGRFGNVSVKSLRFA